MKNLLQLSFLPVWVTLGCISPQADGANFNWTGASPLGGGNSNMSNAANWSNPNAPPNTGGTADLVFSGIARTTPNADVNYTINTLRFTSTQGFALGGNPITLQTDAAVAPLIRNEAAVLNTINNNLTFANSGTVSAQNGNLIVGGVFGTGTTAGNTITLISGAGRSIIFNSSIGGFGSLSKTGSGTVRFNGLVANLGAITIGGGTAELSGAVAGTTGITVNSGTVRLLASNRIPTIPFTMSGPGSLDLNGFSDEIGALSGTGTITLGNGAELIVNQGVNTAFGGPISGTGKAAFTKTGSGSLTLEGSATHTGATTIQQGVLVAGANSVLSLSSSHQIDAGGTLAIGKTAQFIGGLTGSGTLDTGIGSITVDQVEDGGFSGTFGGTGTFIKTGGGTLDFAPAAGHSVAVVVAGGVLRPGSLNSAFGTGAGGTTVLPGGTIEVTNSTVLPATENLTLGGTGHNSLGALRVVAASNVIPGINGNVTLTSDALVRVDRSSTPSPALHIGVSGSSSVLALGNHRLTVSGTSLAATRIRHAVTGAGEMVKAGDGRLFLEGNNPSFTGPITVQSGQCFLAADQAAGSGNAPIQVHSGTILNVGGDSVGNSVSTSRPIQLSGELACVRDSTLAGSGDIVLSPGASLRSNGTDTRLTLAGTGTITGTNTTLGVNTPGESLIVMGRAMNLGTGGLTKNFSGTLQINTPASYSGATNVLGGTILCFNHNVLPPTSRVSVVGGATLDLKNTAQTIGGLADAGGVSLGSGLLAIAPAANRTHSGNISGTGSVIIRGNGSAVQTFSTANTYSGATTVESAGRLTVTADNALSNIGRLTVDGGGILTANSPLLVVGSLAGSGTITMGGASTILSAGADGTSTTFGGTINGSGNMGLTKVGNGTLTLTGTTVPTGLNTFITAGVLRTHSGLPGCPVNVTSGGTLEASGNISSLTLGGTFRPGSNLATGATLSIADQLSVAAGATLQWRVENWTGAPGSGSNVIDAQSVILQGTPSEPVLMRLNVPASLANFTDAPRTFKLARSASPITGYNPAAIQIAYLANGAGLTGTWSTQVTGSDLELTYTPAAGQTYASWIAGFPVGGLDSPTDDPDGDGIPNGIEFVIGGIPFQNDDSSIAPGALTSGGNLVFTYRRHQRASYLDPQVRYSTTLQAPWTTATHGHHGVTISSTPLDPETDLITVTIPIGSDARKFARLAVSIP